MTEENSTTSHLSVPITTREVDKMQTTDGRSMTSSSGNEFEFYFQWAVVVIGVVGTAANALVLYALVASKQFKKHLLIVNQNALDLFSSCFLVITYSLKLCNFYLTGAYGYWLCMMILSEMLIYFGINGSIINLAIITIDRYLTVVHRRPIWVKKWLRSWVVYSAAAFAWLVGIVYNTAITFATSGVVDGVCYAAVFYNSHADLLASVISYMVFFYVIIIVLFIFCYGRILIIVRRQAHVMAAHSAAGSSTAHTQSNQLQTNVIKTMILVSAFFAMAWMPLYGYHIHLLLNPYETFVDGRYYVSMFIAFFYICANPFIYATKFNPVKKVLRDMIPCKVMIQPIA